MTNEDLAAKVYAGEHEAKGLLYDRVYRLIYRYAVRFYTLHAERCVSCGVEIMDMLTEGYFAYTTGSVMNIDGGFTLSRL